MNDDVNRLAREMADAIAAAVASDPRIGECHAKARAEGYELQVSIEALIGFAPQAGRQPAPEPATAAPRRALDITAHDRRFLRSLRIAAEEGGTTTGAA
jgi:hypothetical protein